MHAPVAIPDARLADLLDPQLESGLLAALGLVAVKRPVDPERLTRLPDRDFPGLPYLIDK
jgi:hypothetical protein